MPNVEVPMSTALKETDEAAKEQQLDKASDCLGTQNVQPLPPPPMPPMMSFFDSDFSLNPTSTQSQIQNQGECNATTADSTVVDTTGMKKSLIEYSDSDDADDCPEFEYSVESMEVATESEQQKEMSQAVETAAVINSAQVKYPKNRWKSCNARTTIIFFFYKSFYFDSK